jgi:hypothetical protein
MSSVRRKPSYLEAHSCRNCLFFSFFYLIKRNIRTGEASEPLEVSEGETELAEAEPRAY